MNRYGLVFLYRNKSQNCSILLFPTRMAVDEYIATRSDILDQCWLWYVVEILERSQAEVAAAIDYIAWSRERHEDGS